ncbi:MAG TPA: O-antigen ligase family protein [Candidatus Elarobacter sp.]
MGAAFFLIPLYPAFIALTPAHVPGVSLVPQPIAVALLVLALALAVFWTFCVLSAPPRRLPTVLPVAAFPAAGAVAAVFGFDPAAGALFVAILLGGVVWHAAIVRFASAPHVLETIFRAYLLSGALASLAAIVMVLAKTPSALYTIGHGRAIGTFVVPGELAGYLIVFVPVAFALARRRLRPAPLAPAALAVAAVAFVLTFSRAGWIGMAAAVAALVLMHRRDRGTRYAIAIMGLAVVAVALVFNAHHDPSENFTRISIWEAALHVIGRFPLFGAGPFEFARLYPMVRLPGGEPVAYHAHSVVLSIAAETGLVGLVALALGWWRFVAELRARLRTGSPYRDVAIAVAAGLLGTWVQGSIDTSTLVIFGLWLPFMALAIACAQLERRDSTRAAGLERAAPRAPRAPRARAAVAVTALLLLAVCGFVQVASSSVYGYGAAPGSLPRHLPALLGTGMYAAIERIAPVPFVETVLTDDALRRTDLRAAAEHAARLPAGAVRADFAARIAAAENRTADAIDAFLDAGDDEALLPFVGALERAGRVRDAHDLERRIGDRLAAMGMRPNALAGSWWRLGRLALRLHDDGEAVSDFERASALAPLNTKYLLALGLAALARDEPARAGAYFTRVSEIDPADADAIAGLGLAALRREAGAEAKRRSAQADAINPSATLARRLRGALARARPGVVLTK